MVGEKTEEEEEEEEGMETWREILTTSINLKNRSGRLSPKNTISGFTNPPHFVQRGI